MIIAIDGPAGVGKSTVAKEVAGRLKFGYLDTGAMYRAITFKALQEGIDLNDNEGLGRLAANSLIETRDSEIYLDGNNVTNEIRLTEVNKTVSIVSKAKQVRAHLVARQQNMAREFGDIVVEGRDIGTVVFPDAEVKVFLTAGAKERANRRFNEMREKGLKIGPQAVAEEILSRDKIDSARAVSPLEKSADALKIDTTDKSIDEVVGIVLNLVAKCFTG